MGFWFVCFLEAGGEVFWVGACSVTSCVQRSCSKKHIGSSQASVQAVCFLAFLLVLPSFRGAMFLDVDRSARMRAALEVLRVHLMSKPGSLTQLWPYELLAGCPRANIPALASRVVGGQWFLAKYSEFRRASFTLPDVGSRLLSAVGILDDAIAVGRMGPLHMNRRLWSVLREMFLPHGRGPDEFRFYVAGGFVVSQILGHGDWRDIDVWFTPGFQGGEVRLACGRGPYRVNVLAVTDPVSAVECFDLHICQCAIECLVRAGVRCYRLLMTPACAHAWMQTRVSLTPWHSAIAHNWRRGVRLAKYYDRELDLSQSQRRGAERARDKYHRRLMSSSGGSGALSAPVAPGVSKALWLVLVRGNLVAGVTLRFFAEHQLREHLPNSVVTSPALIYPCDEVVGCPSQQFAYAGAGVSWCVRALAGTTFLVAIPGVGRVLSNYLQPNWLVSRADMDVGTLVGDVRRSLPLLPDGLRAALVVDVPRSCDTYVLECAPSVKPMVMLNDWWRPIGSESDHVYGPETSVLMDLDTSSPLPGRMFCVESKLLCDACVHDPWGHRCRPLVVVDDAAVCT